MRLWILGALLLVGLTLLPLSRHPRDDGFPFSTYPMFATHRPRLQTVVHAIAKGQTGDVIVPPASLGTDEVMQAAAMLRAAAASEEAALALCHRLAAARRTSIEVRSDTYDVLTYFEGDRTPRASILHARCEAPP